MNTMKCTLRSPLQLQKLNELIVLHLEINRHPVPYYDYKKKVCVFISFQLSSSDGMPTIMPNAGVDSKVFQTGSTGGVAIATSTATANIHASGKPSGILNHGGTTASFSGTSTVDQKQPSNTSVSVGGSLLANCGGGQLSTFIVGQQSVYINGVGNCDSVVVPPKKQ